MKWEVVEYEAGRKEGPVSEFIKKQQPQAIAKIAHLINLLEFTVRFSVCLMQKKFENYLYELRIRGKRRNQNYLWIQRKDNLSSSWF